MKSQQSLALIARESNGGGGRITLMSRGIGCVVGATLNLKEGMPESKDEA